jgi:hypothetical protein
VVEQTDVNWVKARGECTAEKMFLLLADRVEADTNEISKAMETEGRSVTFKYQGPSEMNRPSFRVVRKRNAAGVDEGRAIRFELKDGYISVGHVDERGRGSETLRVGFRLDETGECVFEIDAKPVSIWVASRQALEGLFFEF